eukprot:jgi/Undpi1/13088/HiC_scaffold_8.g02750.m1
MKEKKTNSVFLPTNCMQATKTYLLTQGKFRTTPSKLLATLNRLDTTKNRSTEGSRSAKDNKPRPVSAPAFLRQRHPLAPPKAGAWRRRPIAATLFRKYYVRGDLPICVDHRGQRNGIRWTIPPAELDFHVYLPIFFDGLREVEDPYRFLAVQGTLDMIEGAPEKVLPVIPQLVLPTKTALNTREPRIICPTLKILQQMILLCPMIGQALVPYYRQILPVFNLFRGKNANMGDSIDYNQRSRTNIGELVMETLEVMEQFGGPDAFINIKYMIPTAEANFAGRSKNFALDYQFFSDGLLSPSCSCPPQRAAHKRAARVVGAVPASGIGVSIAERGGVKVVGVPIGTDEYVRESAMEIVRNGGAEQLARMLSRMPDKQSANLIATGSMVQWTSYRERVMDPELSLAACKKADGNALWMLEKLLDLPGAAEESSFFADGCPTNMLTLQPHQQAQASLSTGAGGFGLSSAEARRMSASVGSFGGDGARGNKVRRNLPDSDLVWRIWNSVRDLRDAHGVSEEAMANILPETRPQRDISESQGEKETRDLARARQRSQSGSGATAFLRARPVDSASTIPASEFVTAVSRFLGIEDFLAARCPCCGEAEVNTRHARLCHRTGALLNQHQPLVHALSRTLKSTFFRHQVESGAPFHADRNLRMDIVIEADGPRDATTPEYRDKSILLDVTYADPQVGVHMRAESADRNGSAAFTSEARNRNHYARPGQVSFDERSYKLATLAVESFGRLGKEGSDLIDQTARGREKESGGLRPLAWGGNVDED